MYRILLVEDEAAVREGIVRKIDWQAHGFCLAGAFENGRQALGLLETEPVDVIITDINMPVMDGLALAKRVCEGWPDIKVVILTGFDDFSYAQSAIRYRVNEYILKPITAKQLRELLDKLRRELDARAPDLGQAMEALRDRFLERLVAEAVPEEEMERKTREFSLALGQGHCLAAMVDAPPEAVRALARAAAGRGELSRDASGRAVLLCGGEAPEETARRILEEAAGEDGALSAVLGPPVERPGNLHRSFEAAREGWEHLYRLPSGRVYTAAELTAAPAAEPETGELRRRVLRSVKLLEREQAREDLAALVGALRGSARPREALLAHLRKLALQLTEYAEEQGLELSQDILERLDRQPHLDAAHACLREYIGELLDAWERQEDSAARQGMRAVEYIRENYTRPDLSLQDITAHLSMSTSYFSALFKNHTGTTFIEYLTRLRMEKARELLAATDRKNYEVAAAVGYDDPGYFRSIFKKTTGHSPSEYRKRLGK